MEQGTHKQLMARPDGAYAALAKMQMGAPPVPNQDLEKETEKETAAIPTDNPISPQQSLEKQVGFLLKQPQG